MLTNYTVACIVFDLNYQIQGMTNSPKFREPNKDCKLPQYVDEILRKTLNSRMNNSGIVEIDSKSDGTYSMVPVIQTEIK